MRNLSMKKFGTPMGAGPGSASERVGFVSAGLPSALVRASALPLAALALSLAVLAGSVAPCVEPWTLSLALRPALPVVCCGSCLDAWGCCVGAGVVLEGVEPDAVGVPEPPWLGAVCASIVTGGSGAGGGFVGVGAVTSCTEAIAPGTWAAT